MREKICLLTVIMLQIFSAASFSSEKNQLPFYHLKVKIFPDMGTLECKAEIQNPLDTSFVLNKDMEIQQIVADGKPASYNKIKSDILPNSVEYVLRTKIPNNLVIKYSGSIKAGSFQSVISSVNMIKHDLVELAIYVAWFPKLKNFPLFNFQIDVDVPSNFVTITNGFLKEEKTENRRNLTKWESFAPSFDIALLSAPNLKKSDINNNEVNIEIYYDKLPETYVDSMKSNLLKSMERLVDLLGVPKTSNLIRVGYSPRPSWGYVRTPFIIVSENNALSNRNNKFGFARDFRYTTHEIAHYWWSFANTNTPDDWINEGLAEYSAFLVSKDIIGTEFTDELLSEYKEKAASCITETAIAETEGDSPDREVNRYAKPVVIFEEAKEKFGDNIMKIFYKDLYNRFKESKTATTAIFLDEAEKQIGKEAKNFFSDRLYKKNWKETNINSQSSSNINPLFFGTWKGTLNQNGLKLKVVLHIIEKDGLLEASMDSPDQNVKDIPVPKININNDSLIFKLSVTSVIYKGSINLKDSVIKGEWNQSGTPFPLDLLKEDEVPSK